MPEHKKYFYERVLFFLVSLTFIGLQVGVPIQIKSSYIKIAASDLILPVVFFLSLVVHIKQSTKFYSLLPLQVFFSLALFFLWLTYSLWVGFQYIGHLQNWAFFNKYAGFLVLCCYFVTFGILGTYLSKSTVSSIFKLALLISLFSVLYSLLKFVSVLFGGEFYSRFLGFSSNPNSFAFSLALVFFCSVSLIENTNKHVVTTGVFLAFVIFGIILSGSKSVWIAFFPSALLFGALLRETRISIVSSIVLGILLSGLFLFLWNQLIFDGHQTYVTNLNSEQFSLASSEANSASHRMGQYQRALSLWASRPFEGVGLGVFLHIEQLSDRHHIIHSTPIWLLAETGVVGLVLIIFFAILLLLRCLFLFKEKHYKEWGVLGFTWRNMP